MALIGPVTLIFDLLNSKYPLPVWWASILSILGFLGLSVVELGPGMWQTDRRTDRHRPSFIMPPHYGGRGHNNIKNCSSSSNYNNNHHHHHKPWTFQLFGHSVSDIWKIKWKELQRRTSTETSIEKSQLTVHACHENVLDVTAVVDTPATVWAINQRCFVARTLHHVHPDRSHRQRNVLICTVYSLSNIPAKSVCIVALTARSCWLQRPKTLSS